MYPQQRILVDCFLTGETERLLGITVIALLSALLDNHDCLLRDKEVRLPAPVETEMVYLKLPTAFLMQ